MYKSEQIWKSNKPFLYYLRNLPTLFAYWHSSQIYRRNELVLVTESPCGESDGLVLLLGFASNFNFEYLLSPCVRIVILCICMYVYLYICWFWVFCCCLWFVLFQGVFLGVLQVKSKFTGSCDSSCVLWRTHIIMLHVQEWLPTLKCFMYKSDYVHHNASCTRVTTVTTLLLTLIFYMLFHLYVAATKPASGVSLSWINEKKKEKKFHIKKFVPWNILFFFLW